MTKPGDGEDGVKPMDDEKTELTDTDFDGVSGGVGAYPGGCPDEQQEEIPHPILKSQKG